MALAGHGLSLSVSTDGTNFDSINGIKNISLSDGADMIEITDFADSNLKRRIRALRDYSASMDGELEVASNGYKKVRQTFEQGNVLYVKILFDGTNGLTLTMLVESIERSASVDGAVQVSISLQHEGSVAPTEVGTGY